MPKLTHIPRETLEAVQARVRDGEKWGEVAKSVGCGVVALKGNLKRLGMEYQFGRHGKRMCRTNRVDSTHVRELRWDSAMAKRYLGSSILCVEGGAGHAPH
jgi:hypothetical protein